ncbi:MAG: YbeD family protein [Planctomycetaceae bacterium]
MNALASIDLLESTHDFPCAYVLKAIGRAEDGFVGRVVAAVRDQLEADIDPPYRVKATRAGRHVSVTMEPVMQSAWDVIAVYGRIQDIAGLVFLL